ncbi:MAG: transcriptional repressor [Bacteroidetes bacterium]|nr:transcriptional repressor [Bacteroidota bacterium]
MAGKKQIESAVSAQDPLKQKGLSVTDSRRKILQLFMQQKGALSHGDIEKKAGATFDRVTIYRTLQTFLDKGIIHAIPSANNAILYALCHEQCGPDHHDHQHIHFICSRCKHTFCLDHSVTPDLHLPKGYQAQDIDVLVKGVCKRCNTTSK